jgi:hypothetical protein
MDFHFHLREYLIQVNFYFIKLIGVYPHSLSPLRSRLLSLSGDRMLPLTEVSGNLMLFGLGPKLKITKIF